MLSQKKASFLPLLLGLLTLSSSTFGATLSKVLEGMRHRCPQLLAFDVKTLSSNKNLGHLFSGKETCDLATKAFPLLMGASDPISIITWAQLYGSDQAAKKATLTPPVLTSLWSGMKFDSPTSVSKEVEVFRTTRLCLHPTTLLDACLDLEEASTGHQVGEHSTTYRDAFSMRHLPVVYDLLRYAGDYDDEVLNIDPTGYDDIAFRELLSSIQESGLETDRNKSLFKQVQRSAYATTMTEKDFASWIESMGGLRSLHSLYEFKDFSIFVDGTSLAMFIVVRNEVKYQAFIRGI